MHACVGIFFNRQDATGIVQACGSIVGVSNKFHLLQRDVMCWLHQDGLSSPKCRSGIALALVAAKQLECTNITDYIVAGHMGFALVLHRY